MAYALTILRRAQKELASLPKEDYQRVTGCHCQTSRHPKAGRHVEADG